MGAIRPFFRGPSKVEPGGDWARRLRGTGWRILEVMIQHAKDDSLTTDEVADLAGVAKRTARRWLRMLAAEGIARPLGVGGPGRGRRERWTLEPGMPEALEWRRDWQGLQDAAASAFESDRRAFMAILEPGITEVDTETGEVGPASSLVDRGELTGRLALARARRARQGGQPLES